MLRAKAARVVATALRFVANVVIIVSLVAATAIAWTWWHAYQVYQDRVEVIAGKKLVELTSDRDGLRILVLRRWPWEGPGQVRAATLYGPHQVVAYAFHSAAERPLMTVAGSVEIRSGRWQAFLEEELELPEGPQEMPDLHVLPIRVSYANPALAAETLENGLRWSIALPFIEVRRFPHGLLVSLAALPAAACLGWRTYRALRLNAARWFKGRRGAPASATPLELPVAPPTSAVGHDPMPMASTGEVAPW